MTSEADPSSRPSGPSAGVNPTSPESERAPVAPAVSEPAGPVNGSAESVVREDIETEPARPGRLRTLLIGKPRDLTDASIFKHISLVAFLAWVGLGADGLTSSCYGPEEAFVNLGEHRYLAVFLAAMIVGTVFIISACYSHIIEEFPSGGGGYLVASKLLGSRVGVVSGCALLVDYVMTITVSIASAGDALFSLIHTSWLPWKVPFEIAVLVGLLVLNLRGVKESVQVLLPIFLLFLIQHVVIISGAIGMHVGRVGELTAEVSHELQNSIAMPGLGLFGVIALLLHAYSLGGGTYTGLEAVSNSMPVIREPRVRNARRTMVYMAISLSFMAGGLILAYLLLNIQKEEGKTMNYLLTRSFVDGTGMNAVGLGSAFLIATLVSEGALLVVGAQAGFIDGPRVLGYMAHDSWMPRWFSSLSERLATDNGILLMGFCALSALWWTGGDVRVLVVMYSINVFLTFSLSMIGMCRHWWRLRRENALWRRRLALFAVGAALCVSVLGITLVQKFEEGGWVTVTVTAVCILIAFGIHRYYRNVGRRLKSLDDTLTQIEAHGEPNLAPPDPAQPTAVVLVGGYSGLGVHTMLSALRFVPGRFRNFVFVSVGVVDSGNFKGSGAVEDLRQHTQAALDRYVDLARRLGFPATSFMAIGTDAVDELEGLCLEVAKQYPHSTVFAGQLVFERDTWLHRLLHNQTAYSLQRRLHWTGLPMVILPTRVR